MEYAILAFGMFGLALAAFVAWFKPGEDRVRELSTESIDAHAEMERRSGAKDLMPRLQGVVANMERVVNDAACAAESVTKGQGESGGRRRLPAGADFEYQPCHSCGQVFIIDAMQRIRVLREVLTRDTLLKRSMFPSARTREISPLDLSRDAMPDAFFCPTHKHEGVDVMVYLYSGKRRSYDGPDIRVPGDIDYFKIVPATPEHYELAGASLLVTAEEPAKVRVKRGRKSAADKIREATARGEDVSSETATP